MAKAKAKEAEKTEAAPVVAFKGFNGLQLERWLSVPGYDALYEVSNYGRVRSLPRQTRTGILGGRLLKPQQGKNGYLRVTFSMRGKASRALVHRLVLRAFCGPCPEGQESRHLNGDRSDCRLSNLSWGTRSENAVDRVRHGTQVNTRGEHHGMARLTDAMAREIIRLHQAGVPGRAIAHKFSISSPTVSRIASGQGWKHLSREANT